MRNSSPNHPLWIRCASNEILLTLNFIFMVLASIFAHLSANADHLGETARIRGLLRPAARQLRVDSGRSDLDASSSKILYLRFSAESLFRFSKLHDWILCALWFTFLRVASSNVISTLSYLRFCDNFLGSCISYPRRGLVIFPRVAV